MSTPRTEHAALAAAVLLILIGLVGCGRPQNQQPAGNAPGERRAAGKQIRQIGSTTLLPLAERWRSEYNRSHPEVNIAVSGGGSGAGLEALINGSAEIADSSRPIKPKEVQSAEARGIKPVEHVVAFDGIAVIVNPANPLRDISLQTLSDLYTGKIARWDEAGAPGLGEVQLINRDTASGTYEAFKELAVTLGGKDKTRDYAASAMNQTSNQAVLAAVGQSKGAIGYVGLGYVNQTVKVLPVRAAAGKPAVAPGVASVQSKQYPISRPLYCYVNATADKPVQAYLSYIESAEGQRIVEELGFVPLTKVGSTKAASGASTPPARH